MSNHPVQSHHRMSKGLQCNGGRVKEDRGWAGDGVCLLKKASQRKAGERDGDGDGRERESRRKEGRERERLREREFILQYFCCSLASVAVTTRQDGFWPGLYWDTCSCPWKDKKTDFCLRHWGVKSPNVISRNPPVFPEKLFHKKEKKCNYCSLFLPI